MPPATGICLSVAWQFESPPAALSALGPAAGLAVRRGLCDIGIDGIGLKWPNDLVWRDAKLGGILVELRAEGQGPACVVIGVGVNDQLVPELGRAIIDSGGQRPVDLATICGAARPGRNRVAGAIIGRLLELLSRCPDTGVDQMCCDWAEADVLAGREVLVSLGDHEVTGVARGIAADGALLLDTTDGARRLTAGDVSVRLQI
jgi:BirA family biotin operon repressor/biotin-[acetyl-CoA-carboxylase] ligase